MATASSPSTGPNDNSPAIEGQGFTTMKTHKFKYTWKINNFSLCDIKVGNVILSPEFSFMAKRKLRWRLRLDPSAEKNDAPEHVSIYLHLQSDALAAVRATFKLCILSKDGEETNVFENPKVDIFTKNDSNWGYPKFINRDYLLQKRKNLLLPNDTLTIICEIRVIDGTDSQPGADFDVPQCQMSSDVGHWFENSKLTDFKLIVGSEQFLVHKFILAARSSVFAAMFEHELAEQQKNEVEIVDFSNEIIREMLRFIYCGKVTNLRNVAKDLIAAADKYALERLKVMCEKELYASLAVENAAEVLMIADRHSSTNLEKLAIDFIIQHAAEVALTAGYELMWTIPSLMKKVVQAMITKNYKPQSNSGTTDVKSGEAAT